MTGVLMRATVDEVAGLGEVLPLDLQRAGLAAVDQPHLAAAGDVVGDLADRADGVLHREVAHHHALLDHPQDQVAGRDLQQRGRLAHVGVADDDVQPAVLLGVGVRLVAGVDDRPAPRGRAGDALPDVLRALAHRVERTARRLGHLAGADDDLPGHQERDQDVGEAGELARAAHQVVLVAAVGVAGRVGVVLEQVDVAGDALVVQSLLGVLEEPLQDALAGLVVGDELVDVVALGGGVLGMAADVEVEPGSVAQEDVAAAPPADDLAEQVARHLVGAQPALAAERARHAVLVLDAEDAPVHVASLDGDVVPPGPFLAARPNRVSRVRSRPAPPAVAVSRAAAAGCLRRGPEAPARAGSAGRG